MKLKDKVLYMLLTTLIVVIGILFYLNNFYLIDKRNSDKDYAYFAVKDIAVGESFSSNNVKYFAFEKDSIPSTYVVSKEDLINRTASRNIYANEPILKSSVSGSELTKKKFELYLVPDGLTSISEGDTVRIYTQIYNKKTKETFIFKVIDSKQVSKVKYVYDADGNIKGISSLLVFASDEESLNYYNAKVIAESMGTGSGIITLKYNHLLEEDYLEVPQFEIDSPKVRKIIEDNENYNSSNENDSNNGIDVNTGNETENNSNSSTETGNTISNNGDGATETTTENSSDDEINNIQMSYAVKEGETVDTIANNFSTTVESLKKNNPTVDFNKLTAGTVLKIVVDFSNN